MHDVRITSPAPRDVWWQLAESDPLCFAYQTPVGIDAICAAQNARDESRLYELPDGRRLLIPLYCARHLPAGLASIRTPKIGGIISSGPVRPEDVDCVLSDLGRLPYLRKIVRPITMAGEVWDGAAPKSAACVQCRSHVIDLRGGFSDVWRSKFNGHARRSVRKAERAGLSIEQGDARTLLAPFYGLLQLSIERWAAERGEPILLARWRARRSNSLKRLERALGTFGDACRIWIASLDDQPAAAIVVLLGRNAHYTRGAMDKSLAGPSGASFLLQKLAIEEACSAGCRYYNMGETGSSESLARFKMHFGAREYVFPEYRFERLPLSRWEAQLRGIAKSILGRRRR